jgi:hypothetical protein
MNCGGLLSGVDPFLLFDRGRCSALCLVLDVFGSRIVFGWFGILRCTDLFVDVAGKRVDDWCVTG